MRRTCFPLTKDDTIREDSIYTNRAAITYVITQTLAALLVLAVATTGCSQRSLAQTQRPNAGVGPWAQLLSFAQDPDGTRARVPAEPPHQFLLAPWSSRLATALEKKAPTAAVAATLFGPGGFEVVGDPNRPELFDIGSVLRSRQGTCLALVIVGLAVSESVGLAAHPVIEPTHACLAFADGVLDPAVRGRSTATSGHYANLAHMKALVLSERAGYRLAAGQHTTALSDANRAVALAPQATPAAINKAAILVAMGQEQTAMELLSKIEREGRGSAYSAYNLALAYVQTDNPQEALRWYGQACDRAPAWVAAWVNKGSTYAQLGHWPEACLCYQRALALEPRNEPARLALDACEKRLDTNR